MDCFRIFIYEIIAKQKRNSFNYDNACQNYILIIVTNKVTD